MALVIGERLLVGGGLLCVPGRFTRLLSDAFVIVPPIASVGSRHARHGDGAGAALVGYAAFLVWDGFLASVSLLNE